MNTTKNEIAAPADATQDLPILEWDGVRVVTTETLATGYGTDSVNIRMNLTNNRKRFEEGIHHFTLTGSNLKIFKNRVNNIYSQASNKVSLSHPVQDDRVSERYSVSKNARSLTLWTEKGAARMSKIVDTDQAWEFFEKLEDSYFRPRVAEQSASVTPEAYINEVQFLRRELELTRELYAQQREINALRTELMQFKSKPTATTPQQLLQPQPTSSAGELALERERDQLAAMLGRSKEFATISAVERVIEREFSWHPLRKWCLIHHEGPVYLKKYGCAWPRGAWLAVYRVDLEELFG
ncbi:ORF6N domain-containing protein [uncultured Citrobacter sp.]|uniref:ORF6N domain-containing protein n=1 Tax=uncultured Citrobacter sp. TaxID=200446 RepID=UPI002597BD1D|nr:ORF6N domain-containing protein [uncultured Citrobacter sp.]